MKSKQLHTGFYGHPRPLKGLFLTELWERFSFYGIRPLLILYMTAFIFQGGMQMSRAEASALVGLFAGSVYFMTILGGWLADHYLGQIRAVYIGAILMSIGHFCIALNAFFSSTFFYLGLVFIALGSGLFKTCIAVIVGLLYQEADQRRDSGFLIFYTGINIGSFIAPLITGLLAEHINWHAGFIAGGLGMLCSMLIFRFYCIKQLKNFNQDLISNNGLDSPISPHPYAAKLIYGLVTILIFLIIAVHQAWITLHPIFLSRYLTISIVTTVFIYFGYMLFFAGLTFHEKTKIILCFILLMAAALFWSAFEQTYTVFNLFALEHTNRNLFNFQIPTIWFQSINPLFVITLSPVLAWVWTALAKRHYHLTHLSKFILALLFATAAFLVLAFACQSLLNSQQSHPLASPWWLVSSFFLLTLGELCLSPIGLSAMTELAPDKLRGQIMGLWCTAIAIGNLCAGLMGSEILAQSFNEMSGLLYRYSLILLIGAILLFILKFPLNKMLAKPSRCG
ncbi:peptide MFS transporter [Acinetobacter rudis]|uniref:peptide MFS transporter n=1 Tax=Acinetobacter rudis TaxID=632955 RepID=UPI00280CDEDE|nr:peptide MFS transporter [Acinetobacter rudis]MDQ8953341.1 peptide MFS transporter [Acinetobacter rudis]